MYKPWGMGGKYVVQPMWHGWVNHCTTHVAWTGKVLYNSRFSHAAWAIVTSLFPCGMGNTSLNGVYRVNWLRARARAQGWNEEKVIVAKEMEWVVMTFGYMREVWEVRAKNMAGEKPGHKAYAMREAERWQRWAETARTEFAKALDMETFPM